MIKEYLVKRTLSFKIKEIQKAMKRLGNESSEEKEKLLNLKAEYDSDRLSLSVEELLAKWAGSSGLLRRSLDHLKNIPQEERRRVGSSINAIKEDLEKLKRDLVNKTRLEKLMIPERDLTYEYGASGLGTIHPVTKLHNRLAEFYRGLGFDIVDGPEIETAANNFDFLNIPEHHPARDMQDTFYVDGVNYGELLRTHTTSIQARILSSKKIPVKAVCFGKVYRNETEDATHQAMFDQFELLWVDRDLSLPHLLALIDSSLKFLFGDKTKVRFVPKYYPYTQPSVGAQIACELCKSQGCSFCGGSGYVTVGGAGVVHPNVLSNFGLNSLEFTGLAFGLGSSRLAVQMSGLPKLKTLYDADLRYLMQCN
ncbi:MAG: phenylalanine--tRNA ligase subunit alpha [Deltaproteobacteria bacterium]|nr:phenylalanine--tRNA ligase subunit alpha [Deltaproteobacteria bacterium]